MNRVAIAFSTRDRTELSSRTIEPLLQPDRFDLYIVDGSSTDEGKAWPFEYHKGHSPLRVVENIRGGADAAIAHNLTYLLQRPEQYEYIGLVENDVLMTDPKWFDRTMELFDAGARDLLPVGAVSPRAYVDRVLLWRPLYAVMHNLGAGVVIFTRKAAQIVLRHFRTGWTTHNREVFSILSGIDIGGYWAFGGNEHWTCADWSFDKVLAAHGLASLALAPSPIEMIGQNPPLAQQGLVLVDRLPEKSDVNEAAFVLYRSNLMRIRDNWCALPSQMIHRDRDGELVFAHQFDTGYSDGWKLRWYQGFGPFGYESTKSGATLDFPVFGPWHVLIRGHDEGPASANIKDRYSGYEIPLTLQAGVMQAVYIPATLAYRNVQVTATTPGLVFHGVQCSHPQPRDPSFEFDWTKLPKP